jgi:hypothetical protein
MAVPFAFANLSGNIALSKLDSNFNTPITLGTTSVLLGNTATLVNGLTLSNVTITSGNVTALGSALLVSSGGTGLVTLPVNNVLLGNGTSPVASVAPGTAGNVLTSTGSAWISNAAVGGGGTSSPILESYQTISSNYTITAGSNGFSVGPVSIATGVVVTVGTGQTWLIAA